MLKQAGFSILELLLAMAFTSMLMLSAASMLPKLQQQNLRLYRQYRLEQSINHVLFTIEKEIRRAGFLMNQTVAAPNSLLISQHPQSKSNSCIVIRYDLNRNGVLDGVESQEPEYFAYRWLNGMLEQQRGSPDCYGVGWANLFDPAETVVTDFKIHPYIGKANNHYIALTLQAHWQKTPLISQRVTRYVNTANLSQ